MIYSRAESALIFELPLDEKSVGVTEAIGFKVRRGSNAFHSSCITVWECVCVCVVLIQIKYQNTHSTCKARTFLLVLIASKALWLGLEFTLG